MSQKKFWVQENFLVPKNYGSKKNLCSKNFRFEKIVSKNLGGGNYKSKKMLCTKIKSFKKMGPKTLVKIVSIIADILLLWRNVKLKVGIC